MQGIQKYSIFDIAAMFGLEVKPNKAICCPFHDDHSPSMVIYDADHDRSGRGQEHFYCFGCGEHGDAVKLYALLAGVSIKEALDFVRPKKLSEEDIKAKRKRTSEIKEELEELEQKLKQLQSMIDKDMETMSHLKELVNSDNREKFEQISKKGFDGIKKAIEKKQKIVEKQNDLLTEFNLIQWEMQTYA